MPGLRLQSATLGIGSPRLTLVENICLWAAEQRDLTRSNIKHLVWRIRKGNSPWPRPKKIMMRWNPRKGI